MLFINFLNMLEFGWGGGAAWLMTRGWLWPTEGSWVHSPRLVAAGGTGAGGVLRCGGCGGDGVPGEQLLPGGGDGAAGVPGGSLPLLMGVMAQAGVPPDGIAIVLGVDRILDMGRTVTNVMGDQVCAAYIDRVDAARS